MGSCHLCGECLHRCVYLHLDRAVAAEQMALLDAGEPAPLIEQGCLSCAACDLFCPHDAEPYGRILHRFYTNYLRDGLAERARYFMPTEADNFRTYVVERLPDDERARVAAWAAAEPTGQVLYPGCNLVTSAYLTESGIFDDLTIAGGLEDCCGEMYYRFGLHDLVTRFAERHMRRYNGRGIERMVFVCPAGLNMFTNLLPDKFGARFDFETMFFTDYLHELLDASRLQITHPLSGSVTVHDSCHGRLVGASMMDSVRRLLERLGLEVIEAAHSREDGYCCGIAAGAPRQSVTDLGKAVALASYEYALADGAEVVCYCTGCYLTLAGVPAATGLGKPVRHVLELVGEAIGRPVSDRLGTRARLLLKGIVQNALPGYLSRRRFWMD
jgi:Fe-S oxidoreductase